MAYQKITLKIKNGFMLRKVGAARMVVPVGPRMKDYKGVITINESGAFLFGLLQQKECAFGELAQALITEYGIDEKTARDAVNQFLSMCMAGNLLESEIIDALPEEGPYIMLETAQPQEETPVDTTSPDEPAQAEGEQDNAE